MDNYATLNLKPLSVNEAWKGRKFKSPVYKSWELHLNLTLPKLGFKIEKEDKLCLSVEMHFSNSQADLDNPLKMFQDGLQKKYNFKDAQIWEIHLYKFKVKKGEERIRFLLERI